MKKNEKVTGYLYTRKLSNGNKSIVMQIEIDGKRQRETLQGFTLLKEIDRATRQKNKRTMQEAEQALSDRIKTLEHNPDALDYQSATLQEFIQNYIELKRREGYKGWKRLRTWANHLHNFNPKATLGDLDKNFIIDFQRYLTSRKASDKPLSPNSVRCYLRELNVALKRAFQSDYINENPFVRIERRELVKHKETHREYLDKSEKRRLEQTDCPDEMIKRSFLFSCVCGLRLSDIRNLKWSDIKDVNGKKQVLIRMEKTDREIAVPLCNDALIWLPKEGKPDDNVFTLPSHSCISYKLREWTEKAQISKHITFHCARHTFATLLLNEGVNLAAVSSLLGHQDISTTQIYAKVTDPTRWEAVSRLDSI